MKKNVQWTPVLGCAFAIALLHYSMVISKASTIIPPETVVISWSHEQESEGSTEKPVVAKRPVPHCADAIHFSDMRMYGHHNACFEKMSWGGVPLFQRNPTTDTAFIRTIADTSANEAQVPGQVSGARGNAATGQPEKHESPLDHARDEVHALKEHIIELQNKGKLGFRKIVACRSVEGFGTYSPIETGQALDKIVFYCEPSNVSTLKSGDRYVIDCSVDFVLADSSGRVLLGKQNALKINRVSRSPVLDLYFKVEMRVKKFMDRSVFLKTVLHDKIKNQTVSVTNRINVNGGTQKKTDGI